MPRTAKPIIGVYEKNPGSGIWYARLRVNGKLIRKKIGTRQQAQEYVEKARTIRASGNGVLPETAKRPARLFSEIEKLEESLTIGELCNQYLKLIQDPDNPERPRDQENPPQRLAVIKNAFGYRAPSSIKPYEIKDWLISLKLSPGTLNRYKSTFSAVYRYAKERGLVSSNPVRDFSAFNVPLTPDPRYMTDAEEAKLRAVIQRWIDECPPEQKLTQLFLRSHLVEITVAAGTGMRKANQYSLRWEDVDFDNRLIRLPITKNGDPHLVPMIDDVYNALREQKAIQREIDKIERKRLRPDGTQAERMVANGRVFNNRENRTWFAKARREAKIKHLRWHDLSRHTAGSRLGLAGVDLKVIQEVLGQKTLGMAARYTHLNKEHIAEKMKALNRPNR